MTNTANTSPAANTTTGQVQKGTDAAAVWNAAADSSPQRKAAAARDGRLHLELTNGACLCGCNQTAVGRFRPGHDATLRGKLTRAALHGAPLVLWFGDKRVDTTARGLATKLDSEKHSWSRALDVSVERARKAAAEAKARRAKAAAERAAKAAEQGQSSKLTLESFAS